MIFHYLPLSSLSPYHLLIIFPIPSTICLYLPLSSIIFHYLPIISHHLPILFHALQTVSTARQENPEGSDNPHLQKGQHLPVPDALGATVQASAVCSPAHPCPARRTQVDVALQQQMDFGRSQKLKFGILKKSPE